MSRRQRIVLAVALAAALAGAVVWLIVDTLPVGRSVRTYTELLSAANRPGLSDEQRLVLARRLCSTRYLQTHDLRLAAEGGIVGMPRNIHTRFQAWRHGPHVWLCPTNRVGPVYQFVKEHDSWRFDGPVGLLRGRGEMVPYEESP